MEDYQIAGIMVAMATVAGCFRVFWDAFGGPDLRPRPAPVQSRPLIDVERYGEPVASDEPLPFPGLQDGDTREMTERSSLVRKPRQGAEKAAERASEKLHAGYIEEDGTVTREKKLEILEKIEETKRDLILEVETDRNTKVK